MQLSILFNIKQEDVPGFFLIDRYTFDARRLDQEIFDNINMAEPEMLLLQVQTKNLENQTMDVSAEYNTKSIDLFEWED